MSLGGMDAQHEQAVALLGTGRGRVHCIGIGGVGMAGVAFLLRQRGFTVSGCDQQAGRLCAWLEAQGIVVRSGHDPAHLEQGVAWVVTTPAVSAEEPELKRAGELGLPVTTRGAVLPALLAGRTSIAVAGTHGKTTTAVFTAALLAAAGRAPAWCIGGESPILGAVAGTGDDRVMVVEADESDGTLALYDSDIAVVTHIEYDHMEHFDGPDAFEACFRRFVTQARRVVYCRDAPGARAMCEAIPGALSYGLDAASRVRAAGVREEGDGMRFELIRDDRSMGAMVLPVPGRHNVLNALAAIAVAGELGIEFAALRPGLARLALPRRRFEVVVQRPDWTVISDYAHHPTEIAALARTAERRSAGRRVAVFQPHRYTRTRALGAAFPKAFQEVDEVILVPVYPASEPPLAGGTVWDLYRHFREQGRAVRVAAGLREAWAYVQQTRCPGDVLLIVGAGDIERMAEWAAASHGEPPAWNPVAVRATLAPRLENTVLKVREPLAPKTGLRVGGQADLWADVGSVSDLCVLWQWAAAQEVPVTLMGQGRNTVVPGVGIRGLTLRLRGPFRRLRREDDGWVAGAGVSCRRLLNRLERAGGSGLEFLESVPGTVGGMVHMNAGAWGGQILDHVLWIRCLNPDGGLCIVKRNELDDGYRTCSALAGRVVIEAAFGCVPDSPERIRRRRAVHAERRAWMEGVRSAGSVFRNPPGGKAGRLLEEAGMKGARVGAAEVLQRHANVIRTARGATAEDVLALMAWMRQAVKQRCGVELIPEVVVPGSKADDHVV